MAKMSLWRRLGAAFTALAGGAEEPAPAEKPAGFKEALGVTVDADEDQWRPLTGDDRRDLSPLSKTRMREIAYYLWRANPLGNRTIELPLAYLLAEGIKLVVEEPKAQGWLDAFWRDPINKMGTNLPKMMRELGMYGEQCWPAFTNEVSGAVRLGYLDPEKIAVVVRDPDNGRQPIGVVTKRDAKGRVKKYRVIVNGRDEELFTERTRQIRATDFPDGECFYFTVNDLQNGDGHSDLLPLSDWIDGYDQFLFGELERVLSSRAFVWDVTLKGATQDEVDARAKKISPPKPGSVRVHNDAEEWNSVSPDLKASDTTDIGRLFRNHVLGGGSIPEHWYGGGGDVNRSTGDSMSEPTFKIFSMRQAVIKAILEEIGTFVVRQRLAAESGKEPDPADATYHVKAEFPEMVARDTTRYAAALQQVVAAAVAACDRGLITEELAVRMIQSVATRLGVDFDAKAELEAAKKEASANSERDLFANPPPPLGKKPQDGKAPPAPAAPKDSGQAGA